ncbi:E3 ubiquitin-protein ligase AIP2 [Euphorbia lathyris]|uniref:E3 ubiquitin-protein ligase AIP2 n=1 Tax=Euphorbia lathyris TaxID=212925 RepID=UPI0033144428
MASEEELKQQLEELQKQLAKKQIFEEAVSSIKTHLRDFYLSSSPSLRKLFYSVVCRVATILKTRYTAPGFWLAGLGLFQEAETLVSDSSEKEHLKNCIVQAKEHLHLTDNPPEVYPSSSGRGYLFEGHLTVDPEPPQPQWLVQSNLMNSIASVLTAEPSVVPGMDDNNRMENASNILQELLDNLEVMVNEPRAPAASKEVVAKLPVITLTEEILANVARNAECAICKENLMVGDKMQELPCKHRFHPPCLKPWLEEHNSCPICRHELRTDDDAYERWKRDEEERKAADKRVNESLYI